MRENQPQKFETHRNKNDMNVDKSSFDGNSIRAMVNMAVPY